MKFQLLIKTKTLKNKDFSCIQILIWCIYHAINIKMPTIVGVLTFYMSASSQAMGTKSTLFLTHKERSGLCTLGLRKCYERDKFHIQLSWENITQGPGEKYDG